MSHDPGSVMPVHHVSCLGCGCALALKTYWRAPRCKPCRRGDQAAIARRSLIVLREQARRYRILTHLLGYEPEQFDELVAEIRSSPMAFRRDPESRSARYDVALERRSARAKKAA